MSAILRWRPRLSFDLPLLLLVAALIGIGLPTVFSASNAFIFYGTNDTMYFLKRQLGFVALGVIALAFFSQFNYRWLRFPALAALAGIMGVLGVLRLFAGTTNGAVRWVMDGSIQPSEWAKPIVIVYVSYWLSLRRDMLHRWMDGFWPFMFMIGLSALLILAQPDLSTAIVIIATALAMFFVAGAPLSQLLVLTMMAAGMGAYMMWAESWRLARLLRFMDPLADSSGDHYQAYQIILALGNGGLTGNGFSSLFSTVGFVPVSHTDAIFAVIGNDFGMLGCVLVIVLFSALIWQGMSVALNAPDLFGRLIGIGITSWFGVQAFLNMASVTSLIPFTGIPLPFISLGGSALVTEMAAVGILLNISSMTPRVHKANARMASSVSRPAYPARGQ